MPGEGTDTIRSDTTFDISTQANFENIELTGLASIDATGNTLANRLTGNDGDNRLDGGTGRDTLIGGAGNDTYVVDDYFDETIEAVDGGIDGLISSISRTLAAHIETLTLTGLAALAGNGNDLANAITGNSGNNALRGNGGDDTLNGGLGSDLMVGGEGNDTYYVDAYFDQTIETAGAGTDHVISSISRTLAAHIENLTLTGLAALAGNGNDLANAITGNSGNNALRGYGGDDTLDGGLGGDLMVGGAGNDTYFVDAYFDQTIESAGEGIDLVISSISRTLAANVEDLVLTGLAALAGNGNGLANDIIGNTGNNALRGYDGDDTLDGGLGSDLMVGGAGNDTYYVDAYFDQTIESANEGTDSVISSISRSLTANIENLTLTGLAALSGNGNDLDNTINGNSGSNVLRGYAGNDVIRGNAGADTILGGLGRDTLSPGNDSDRDIIRYASVVESTGVTRDLITGMDLNGEDRFDFPAIPTLIRAQVSTGTLSAASFDADLSAAIGAAQLGAGQAVLFDLPAGNLNVAGRIYLIVDANGIAGYQAGQDYVIELANHTGTLTLDDFI